MKIFRKNLIILLYYIFSMTCVMHKQIIFGIYRRWDASFDVDRL